MVLYLVFMNFEEKCKSFETGKNECQYILNLIKKSDWYLFKTNAECSMTNIQALKYVVMIGNFFLSTLDKIDKFLGMF